MNGQLIAENPTPNVFFLNLLAAVALTLAASQAFAQVPVDENGEPLPVYAADEFDDSGSGEKPLNTDELLSNVELEELVGPVALYPDDLLAIVLPASTYPLEIVQAARFLEALEDDSKLEPDEEWDESIVALLNYPDVVRMLDEDIDWTWRLGEAVISQQNDVIAAVESFRDRAYAAGNLKSDEHQKVSYDEGIIEIVPVSEEIIYVPYYEPTEVIVQQSRPVYYYYPDPYPIYYYPYPTGYRFRSGFFWGVTTAYTIGWSNHYLHVYHPSYWGHPYYGRYYYGHYYRRPSITVYNNWYVNNRQTNARYRYRDGDYWRPRSRAGSRQDEPRVRNYHYSPNGSHNSRDAEVRRQDRLRVREDGRMDLNLRQRDSRRATTNRGATIDDSQRSTTANRQRSSTGRAAPNRGDRTSNGNRSTTTSVNSNRSATSTARVSQRQSRQTDSRPEISFRDRGSDTARVNARTSSRSSASDSGNRRPAATAGTRGRTSVQPQIQARLQRPTQAANTRTNANRVSSGTGTSRSTAGQVAAPSRASQPAVRESSPTRRASAPRPRQSAQTPRAAAPRQSAPAARQRAPAARTEAQPARRSESGSTGNRSQTKPRQRNRN